MINCLSKSLITAGLILGMNMPIWPAQAETIRMATIDFCPFTCNPDFEGGKEGFMTDVVRYALKNAGYNLEVIMLPYIRAVKQTRAGEVDGIVVVGKLFAPDLIYPEMPVVSQRVAFIVKKGTDWKYKGVNSLKTKTIGIVKGYHSVDEDLQNYLLGKENADKIQVIYGLDTTERSIKKLLAKRIDIYLEGEISLFYALEKLGVRDKVVFAGFTDNAFDDYVGFSPECKKADELASLISRTITDLKKTGKLNDFLTPYIGNYSLNQLD